MTESENAPHPENIDSEARELVATLARLAEQDPGLFVGLASATCWRAGATAESLILAVVLRAVHAGRVEALLGVCLAWLRSECPPSEQPQAVRDLFGSLAARLDAPGRQRFAELLEKHGLQHLAPVPAEADHSHTDSA